MHVNIPYNYWHANPSVFNRYGIDVLLSGPLRSVVKFLITLKPYGIFESYFAYLFIFMLSSHPGMQNDDKGLLSIILAGQGLLE